MKTVPLAAIVNFSNDIVPGVPVGTPTLPAIAFTRAGVAPAPRRPGNVVAEEALPPGLRALRSLASPGERAAPGPKYYRRPASSYVVSDAATRGALSIFIEGARAGNSRLMLFGLSVLRNASTHQISSAILVLESAGVTDAADVSRLLDCGT